MAMHVAVLFPLGQATWSEHGLVECEHLHAKLPIVMHPFITVAHNALTPRAQRH
jgi:hypothetical protein